MSRALAVLLVAAALAAASASAGATTLTHAQLVERAFTICAAASNGIARVRPALTFAGAADATAAVLVHLDRAVARLAALRPSPADAPRLRRYVRLLRLEVTALRRAERAARRDDRAGFRAAHLDAADVSLRARAVANRLGLEVCGTI